MPADVGALSIKIIPDMKGFAAAVGAGATAAGNTASKGMAVAMGSGFKKAGVGLTAAVTAPVILAGAAIAKAGQEFDSTMGRIAAISGESGEAIEAVATKAKDLGVATRYSANEAAGALEVLTRAGYDTEKSIGMVDGVLNLAASDNLELADAAGITSAAMSAFNLEASDAEMVADAMAGASSAAFTGVSELGEAFKYTALKAADMGLTVPETTAALAALADAGIKGSSAGTSFRAMLTELGNPSAEQAKIQEELGIAFFNNKGEMNDLTKIAGQLKTATKDLTAEQRTKYIEDLAGVRGGSALLAMMQKGEEGMKALTDATSENGKAAEMGENSLSGLEKTLNLISGSLETLAVELYGQIKPALETAAELFYDLTNAVLNFVRENPGITKVGLAIAGIAAAVGPVMLALSGLSVMLSKVLNSARNLRTIGKGAQAARAAGCAAMAAPCPPVAAGKAAPAAKGAQGAAAAGASAVVAPTGFQKILAVVKSIGPQILKWGSMLLRFAGPIGLIVTALTGVGLVIKSIATEGSFLNGVMKDFLNSEPVQALQAAFAELGELWNEVVAVMKEEGQAIWDSLMEAWNSVGPQLMEAFDQIKTAFSDVMAVLAETGALDALKTAFKVFLAVLASPIIVTFIGVISALKLALMVLPPVIRFISTHIQAFIRFAATGFSNLASIVSIVVSTIRGSLTVMAGVFNSVKARITATVDALKAVWGTLVSAWEAVASFVTGSIRNWTRVFKSMVAPITGAVNNIKSAVSDAFNNVVSSVSGAMDTVKSTVSTAWENVKSSVSDAVAAVAGFAGQFLTAGYDLVMGLVRGIQNGAGAVADAARQVAQNAVNAAKSALKISSPSRVFIAIGGQVVEGLVIGLGNGKSAINQAMRGVMDMPALEAWFAEQKTKWADLGGVTGQGFATAVADMLQQAQATLDAELAKMDAKWAKNKKRRKLEKKAEGKGDNAARARKQLRKLERKQERKRGRVSAANEKRMEDLRRYIDAQVEAQRQAEQEAERVANEPAPVPPAPAPGTPGAPGEDPRVDAEKSINDKILSERESLADKLGKVDFTSSAGATIRNMNRQAALVTGLNTDIAQLRAKGLSQAAVAKLGEMDPKEARRLSAQLLNNPALIGQLNNSTATLANAANTTGAKIVADQFRGLGMGVVNGIESGLLQGEAQLAGVIAGLGDTMINSLKKTLGIASPSKEFAKLGMETGAGMALGIKKSTPQVLSATDNMVSLPGAKTDTTGSVNGRVKIDVHPREWMDEVATARLVAKELTWELGV